MSIYADPNKRPSLDPSRYSLEQDEREFFQLLTGIQDEEELRNHILTVQAKAYQIYGYPCIRRFSFIRLKIARLPGYPKALKLLEQRKDPILLDIGCCFGNDVRKAVVDGWPVENVLASDLRQGFWDAGHELFKSTPASFPAAFIPGDIFDSAMLAFPPSLSPSTPPPRPLNTLTSLTPLTHSLSAIHASSFFHLFPEERQRELGLRLAALLLPDSGSIIFGQHGGRPVKGFRTEVVRVSAPQDAESDKDKDKDKDANASEVRQRAMFCHSPESWKELWTEDIFGPHQDVRVKVDTELKQVERWDFENQNAGAKFWVMNWSVEVL